MLSAASNSKSGWPSRYSLPRMNVEHSHHNGIRLVWLRGEQGFEAARWRGCWATTGLAIGLFLAASDELLSR
jgi:hypothetical protein